MLHEIIPFRYLTAEQREALRGDLTEQAFAPGETLVRQGDAADKRVFLLERGTVETVDGWVDPPRRLGVITEGHYFGERAALFDEERAFAVRALEPVRVLSMTGERFLALVRESALFARALGNILRDKQGIFDPFDRFRAELLRGVGAGALDFEHLMALYRELRPALHPHAHAAERLDVEALVYAVRRLPENVSRTFAFYLTETLPHLYRDPDRRFRPVPTAARRRAVYEMLPGKNMVLLRDGLSDLVDLVSCLCLYATEARKIRRRVRDAGGVEAIPASLVETLRPVWPERTEDRLRDVALHHEDFGIQIYKEVENYNSAHAETWCKQIAAATRALVGCDPTELDPGVPVHLVSSNTHSVMNCLSPWLAREAETILAWGTGVGHPLVGETWHAPYDLVCALARDYLAAHPEVQPTRHAVDREAGVLGLDETAFTGIAVQLVDLSRLSGAFIDPGVGVPPAGSRGIVVNIDYAFGEQADHIVANLLALFGRNLASLNVLGKAGGLQGARGDVLVATGFVEQVLDRFHPIPVNGTVDLDRLRRDLPGRGVRRGNLLTVAGTLLQNRMMLHFNRRIWGCVGLEMEGASYLRQMVEAAHRGAVRPDIPARFLYYVSDLPLEHDATLSARLRTVEGLPPLYAVTREILRGVLGTWVGGMSE